MKVRSSASASDESEEEETCRDLEGISEAGVCGVAGTNAVAVFRDDGENPCEVSSLGSFGESMANFVIGVVTAPSTLGVRPPWLLGGDRMDAGEPEPEFTGECVTGLRNPAPNDEHLPSWS